MKSRPKIERQKKSNFVFLLLLLLLLICEIYIKITLTWNVQVTPGEQEMVVRKWLVGVREVGKIENMEPTRVDGKKISNFKIQNLCQEKRVVSSFRKAAKFVCFLTEREEIWLDHAPVVSLQICLRAHL